MRFLTFLAAMIHATLPAQERISVKVDYNDGTSKTINYDFKLDKNNSFELIIPKDCFGDDARSISVLPDVAQANAGDKGYLLASYAE